MLTVTTWNVNSVRLRLPLVERFLAENPCDVLCLQETKCPDADFPLESFTALGFTHHALWGTKGYNGVAILSRYPLKNTQRHEHLDGLKHRHIHGDILYMDTSVALHNLYCPAGYSQADYQANPKYHQKLAFTEALIDWFPKHRDLTKPTIFLGDLNIAPLENDVWDHKKMLKVVSHTPAEIDVFTRMIERSGWVDAMRHFIPPEEKLHTWWTYRTKDWRTQARGRRLDHIYTTPDLVPAYNALSVLKDARGWERPSDHVPVSLTLDL